MKVLITSDWHLDHVTDGHSRYDEVSDAVDHSVKVALESMVDAYIFCGDLSDPDGWAVHRAQSKAVQVAVELANVGIESYWLAGNHDVVEDGFGTTVLSPLAAMFESSGLTGRVWERPDTNWVIKGGIRTIALPFTARSHTYDPEEVIKKYARSVNAKVRKEPHLVLGHLNLAGITAGSETNDMPRGRDVFWPTDVVRKHLPNAVMVGGHYHKAQEYDGVNVVGSLARLTHGEEDNEPSMLLLEF